MRPDASNSGIDRDAMVWLSSEDERPGVRSSDASRALPSTASSGPNSALALIYVARLFATSCARLVRGERVVHVVEQPGPALHLVHHDPVGFSPREHLAAEKCRLAY